MEDGRSMSVLLKHGFAPVEQYQTRGQGPETDIYALSATIYFCLTATMPPASVERLEEDALQPPTALGADLAPWEEEALLWGLAVQPKARPASMEQFASKLYNDADWAMGERWRPFLQRRHDDRHRRARAPAEQHDGEDLGQDGLHGQDGQQTGGARGRRVRGGRRAGAGRVPGGGGHLRRDPRAAEPGRRPDGRAPAGGPDRCGPAGGSPTPAPSAGVPSAIPSASPSAVPSASPTGRAGRNGRDGGGRAV